MPNFVISHFHFQFSRLQFELHSKTEKSWIYFKISDYYYLLHVLQSFLLPSHTYSFYLFILDAKIKCHPSTIKISILLFFFLFKTNTCQNCCCQNWQLEIFSNLCQKVDWRFANPLPDVVQKSQYEQLRLDTSFTTLWNQFLSQPTLSELKKNRTLWVKKYYSYALIRIFSIKSILGTCSSAPLSTLL